MTTPNVDWNRPIQRWDGVKGKPVYEPRQDDVVFVEFEGEVGHWAYNFDGTPLPKNAYLGHIENVNPNPSPTPQSIIEDLKLLSDDERMEVFREFCHYCGTVQDNGSCQCWNDE